MMIGSTISHYRITDKLGEGGMGVVYKATDTKLHRTVALKFLPSHLAKQGPERERFLHEAQAYATLNHPNVTTIYEVDEADGQVFIAMEIVEGNTLSDLIERKQLQTKEAINIAIQIADGLAAAHAKGVVHRDVKPSNILLTKERAVKITDFGLAKLQGVSKLTRTGSTLGTAAYMSPEQAQGEAADERSDIFSFGVVLFEMLSGSLPFRGEHEAAMVYSIVNEEPQVITAMMPDIPPIVANLIQRCLEKDPSERYQHFDDIAADLKRSQKKMSHVATRSTALSPVGPSSGAGPHPAAETQSLHGASATRKYRFGIVGAGIAALGVVLYLFLSQGTGGGESGAVLRTLAILPLENIGGLEENEFFSEGMTEDITTHMAKIRGVNVISRTSAMRYKGDKRNLKEIGKELGASVILEGSVRRAGARVRIVCQLIDVGTDSHLWAETYDRDLKDVFAIQTEVAQKIAAALQAQLSPSEEENLIRKPTENLDAYTLYLKGRYHWRKRTVEDLQKGAEYFRQATTIDPTYALAYAGLSDCLALYHYYNVPGTRPEQIFSEAERFARRAVDLDPNLAEAHTALANVMKEWKWDWKGAENEFLRAIAVDPEYATAYQWYCEVLMTLGREEESIRYARKAVELEPASPVIVNNLGLVLLQAQDYEEAERVFRKAIELDPNYTTPYMNLANVYLLTGRDAEFLAILAGAKVDSRFVERLRLWLDLIKNGQRPSTVEMEQVLAEAAVPRFQRAFMFASAGYIDESLYWLKQSAEMREPNLPLNIHSPYLAKYQSDPRYVEILKSIGASP